MTGEKSTDLQVVGAPVKKAFEEFAGKTGRKLRLGIRARIVRDTPHILLAGCLQGFCLLLKQLALLPAPWWLRLGAQAVSVLPCAEIEPGTYLMANNGCILSTIQVNLPPPSLVRCFGLCKPH